MTVGMAFAYFAEKKVDIAVVEVGLGGRLDSTNIIVPEVALITNIGFDHMDMLGDTLEKIAFEKAGIIKEGVPVVISEYQPETASVFDHVAHAKNSDIYYAEEQQWPTYPTSLLGNYQQKNVKGVLCALSVLTGFSVSEGHIKNGLMRVQENTGLLGRWQVLGEAPRIICDTAHNKEGIALVMKQLLAEPYDSLHMVMGFVKEKDLSGIFDALPKEAHYYFCKPNIPRGKDVEVLMEEAKVYGIGGIPFESVQTALGAAKRAANTKDLIFVGGSNFVVAEVV
jgi:dihydrofolate synthase/folylpolyglutamate synthase